jgi:hemin uptake protein HemP
MTAQPSDPGTTPASAKPPHADKANAPIPSAMLLQGRYSITIEHNGRLYVLQKTRQGKLILTK